MAVIGTLRGEIRLVSPEGNLSVWVERSGRVVVAGSAPMAETRWYKDRLKVMRLAIKQGRAPQGCYIESSETTRNKPWALKMIDAALDVIRQYERPALAYDGPKPNDVLAGVKSPYRVINGKHA